MMNRTKKKWKRITAFALAAVMLFATGLSAAAEEEIDPIAETSGERAVDDSAAEEEVTVEKGDKPYISFGADLKDSERATVLSLFGISEADLENYDVVYVTNEQEHEYLDTYMSASTIGTRALSSVLVMEGEKGSGIHVTTKNITYCTKGMYENALATAGFEDAEVIVAGPFELSGTAALIGAIQAYSVMTKDDIKEDVIDGAIEELVTTGELEEETGNTEEIEGMIAYLKEQTADQNMTKDELEDAVEQAAVQFNVTLTKDQVDRIISLLEKLQGLDLNMGALKNQAQSVYDRLQKLGIDVDTAELAKQAEGFFQRLINWLKGLFNS